MNEDLLLQKLRNRLAEPIHTEEQVLFVLIGARKLIELGGYKKNELLAARFMTDWAVHSVIDRNSWSRESLAFMDGIFKENKFWDQLTPDEQQRFTNILSLENGRIELMDVFRKALIFPVAFGHPIGWRVFLGAFLELINDCPLKLTDGKVIDAVTMKMLEDPLDKRKLHINWNFSRIDKQAPFVITLPMVVEKPDFHFGRGGKASDDAFEAKLQAIGYTFS
jgi:hypothetical protein